MGDFFDKAKKLGAKAYDQAEDALEVGRYKAKISSKKGDMEESYKKIGQYLYEKYSDFSAAVSKNGPQDTAADIYSILTAE